jgi:DNA-binding NarL/FixJ family response regulator
MKLNIAELIVKTLAAAEVQRIYGIVEDSLNGLTEALRRQKRIDWVLRSWLSPMAQPDLSQRELQVLKQMALGKSNKEIGQVL